MSVPSSYITLDEAVQYLYNSRRNLSKESIETVLNFANSIGVISILEYDGQPCLLKLDFINKQYFFLDNASNSQAFPNNISFDNFFQTPVYFGENTHAVVHKDHLVNFEYALLQNLALLCEHAQPDMEMEEHTFVGAKIWSRTAIINSYLSQVKQQIDFISDSKSSFFSNSAYYMGNKNSLAPFLVTCVNFHKPVQMDILDLMCGSGAASSAFSNFSPVFASDAQEFCTILASLQGSSKGINQVTEILNELEPFYVKNFDHLASKYEEQLKIEDDLFHMDYSSSAISGTNSVLYQKYLDYVEHVQLYSSDVIVDVSTDIHDQVKSRKINPKLFPYCLFTTYFANVYVGLMQAIQIDSIRYSIDQLKNSSDRQWALGALVVTCSVLGTSYGGHFAQPIKITERNISKVLRTRNRSVWHEFSKRLQELVKEGMHQKHRVSMVSGPWEKALATDFTTNEVFVYVDAPYKREEYSRYYHLLETLVQYNYPDSSGKGRLSSKSKHERFSSDFFTHSKSKLNNLFIQIFTQILSQGWCCAWSYSDSGMASLAEVIHQTHINTECNITIYHTPYQHMNHGKAIKSSKKKSVLEYVVIFENRKIVGRASHAEQQRHN